MSEMLEATCHAAFCFCLIQVAGSFLFQPTPPTALLFLSLLPLFQEGKVFQAFAAAQKACMERG